LCTILIIIIIIICALATVQHTCKPLVKTVTSRSTAEYTAWLVTYIIYVLQTFFCYGNVNGETTPSTIMFLIRLLFPRATVNVQTVVPALIHTLSKWFTNKDDTKYMYI